MRKSEEKNIQFGEGIAKLNKSSLLEGEIHLWGISLDSDPLFFEKCKAALTDAERARISYFSFKQVQDNYVISQGGLRLLLSSYLSIEPRNIKMEKHGKGKPFTSDDPSLCFNISNSGNYCVYAFSRAGEVGIDIEEIRLVADMDDLIEKNFTEKEKDFINKNKEKRQERFFKFWTIKEAYLKAIGEGMRLTPDNLEFTFENGNYKLEAVKGIFEQEEWLFKEIKPSAEYVGTITFKGAETKIGEMRFV